MLKGGQTFKLAEKNKWTDEEVVRIIFGQRKQFNFPWIMLKCRRKKTSVQVPVSNETLFLPRLLAYLVLYFTLSTFLLGFVCFP